MVETTVRQGGNSAKGGGSEVDISISMLATSHTTNSSTCQM